MLKCQKSYTSIKMTSITWAGPRCVQELGTNLGPQNHSGRLWYLSLRFKLRHFVSGKPHFMEILYLLCFLLVRFILIEIKTLSIYFNTVCFLLGEKLQRMPRSLSTRPRILASSKWHVQRPASRDQVEYLEF